MTTIAPNQIELKLNNGVTIFFSYKTPVAAFVPGKGYIRTEEYHSVTTSRHTNKWVGPNAVKVPQAEIDALVA